MSAMSESRLGVHETGLGRTHTVCKGWAPTFTKAVKYPCLFTNLMGVNFHFTLSNTTAR